MYQGGDSTPPSPPINKVALWLDLNVVSPKSIKESLPAAPTLFRFKEGCDVTLYIRDNSSNELGFFLYRLNPGATIFTRIATFGPHAGDKFIEYLDKGLYGKYQYYVAAFNILGESTAAFTNVDFSDSGCLKPENTAYKFSQINLSLDVPAEKLYCYYSAQEGEWSRVPEDPNAFIYPTSNGYDLTRALSDLVIFPQRRLKLDCWSWQGGSLVYLGAFDGGLDSSGTDTVMNLKGDLGAISAVLKKFQFAPDFGKLTNLDFDIKKLPAPYDLRGTNLIDVCHRHFPGISLTERADCAEAIKDGSTILVWEWDPICPEGGCEAKIDGFKVYGLDSTGSSYLVATIPERWQNVSILPWFSLGDRYYVRSYLGDHLSKRSNIYTVTGLPEGWKSIGPLKPSTYTNKDVTTSKFRSTPCEKTFPGEDLSSFASPSWPVEMEVGFTHNSFSTGCLETSDHIYRGRIFYDLSAEKGYVAEAQFGFSVVATKVNGADDTKTSCALTLNLITAMSGDEVTSFKPYLGMPKFVKLTDGLYLDVTTAVKEWVASPSTNLGFLLTGQESGFSTADQSCMSRIQINFLDLNYFLK
jgi:hypothetical protein